MSLTVRKLSYPMGVEILGVDITKPLDDATFHDVHQQLLDHCLIAFRGQAIAREQYVGLMRRFGELSLDQGGCLPECREITCVVNKPRRDGGAPDPHVAGSDWHSDGSFRVNPTKITVLHAIEVPEVGGDTEFANLYLAYETLSEGMKKLIDGMQCVHMQEEKLLDHTSPEALERSRREKTIAHPLVKIHPETGRKSLYVGDKAMFLAGMNLEESRPLIDYLRFHARRTQFVYRHGWRKHDVVIWDNRCTNHNALGNFDRRNEPRHMEKISVHGPITGHVYVDPFGTRNLTRTYTY
jgi:taurine dioxygenase